MIRRGLVFLLLLCVWMSPAAAAGDRERALFAAVGLEDLLEIMREEGRGHAADLGEEFLDGGAGGWHALSERIYAPGRLRQLFAGAFAGRMSEDELAAAGAFFNSDLGRRVVELELAARRALLDPDIEQASRDNLAEMAADAAPRLALVRRFVEVNDLVESNVVGTMNAQFAFLMGLGSTPGPAGAMDETRALAEVWSQEDSIRRETRDWLLAYLAMAYQPLSDAELESYIAFSGTAAGRAYNRAIFAAFDEMFTDVSWRLGAGLAQLMEGERL